MNMAAKTLGFTIIIGLSAVLYLYLQHDVTHDQTLTKAPQPSSKISKPIDNSLTEAEQILQLSPNFLLIDGKNIEKQWFSYSKTLRQRKPQVNQIGLPEQVNTSRQKLSDNGLFNLELTPSVSYLPLNKIHHWDITVSDKDNTPLEVNLKVLGGMPLHGHGFPTQLKIENLENSGHYQLNGVKFNMIGWWQIVLIIETEDLKDSITFNIPVNY